MIVKLLAIGTAKQVEQIDKEPQKTGRMIINNTILCQ